MNPTIEEGWQSYNGWVLPADAGESQRLETRRAFYAGSWHMIQAMLRISADDVSVNEGARILGELAMEAQRYYEEQGAES